MSRPLTPPPSATPEARARNGGTSAPTGGSVWDVDAVVPDEAQVAPEPQPTPTPTAVEPAPEPARATEPLLGATPLARQPVSRPKPALPASTAPRRSAPQTPNARQREKARQAIAAAAAGEPARRGLSGRTLALLLAVAALAVAAAVAWLVLSGGDDTEAAVPVGTLADQAPAVATTLAVAPLDVEAPTATVPVTLRETVPTPPTSSPPTSPPGTVAGAASAAATVADAVTTTVPATTVPATTVPATTVPSTSAPATLAAVGPRIIIEPRREPCKFGNDCLVAGFSIVDFATQPDSFVCEFADGSRYTLALASQRVDYACATGSSGDSITIEIAGVRSDTAVHG